MCKRGNEDVDHLLLQCAFVMAVWEGVLDAFTLFSQSGGVGMH